MSREEDLLAGIQAIADRLEERVQADAIALYRMEVLTRVVAAMVAVAPEEQRTEARKALLALQLLTNADEPKGGAVIRGQASAVADAIRHAEAELARRTGRETPPPLPPSLPQPPQPRPPAGSKPRLVD